MHFEVLVNNDLRVLPAVGAFAREALHQTSLASPQIDKLVELVERSVRTAVEHAYPVVLDGVVYSHRVKDHQGLEKEIQAHHQGF